MLLQLLHKLFRRKSHVTSPLAFFNDTTDLHSSTTRQNLGTPRRLTSAFSFSSSSFSNPYPTTSLQIPNHFTDTLHH
jgi:hypothetical protein